VRQAGEHVEGGQAAAAFDAGDRGLGGAHLFPVVRRILGAQLAGMRSVITVSRLVARADGLGPPPRAVRSAAACRTSSA
jgi:hypothetical protein